MPTGSVRLLSTARGFHEAVSRLPSDKINFFFGVVRGRHRLSTVSRFGRVGTPCRPASSTITITLITCLDGVYPPDGLP